MVKPHYAETGHGRVKQGMAKLPAQFRLDS